MNTAGTWFGVFLVLAMLYGWVANLYHFTQCDFSSPYKCEIIRGIGVVIPFVGAVTGYIDIAD